MGEAGLMSSYLRSKLSSVLNDAEANPGGNSAGIISRIRSLNDNSRYDRMIPKVDLRELTESVSDWHVLLHTAAVSKKRWFDPRRLLLHPFSKWVIKRRMQTRLDSINKKLTRAPQPEPLPAREVWIEQTRPLGDLSHIIGFKEEAEKIEDWLLPAAAAAAWRVVGIVGRCGCGKTTLAQKVFARFRIAEEFSPRIWVCLSGNEDSRERVLSLIILKDMGHEHDVSEESYEQLRERLEGKRYLIVLDGAWTQHDLLINLPRESGGAVIVTSRLGKTIGKMAEDDPDHVILVEPQLSHDDCFQIFSQTLQQQEKVHLQDIKLDSIADDLKRNIDCLPLAAKTLGTILPGLLLKSCWIRARDTIISWGNDRRYWKWTSLPPPQQKEEVAELLEVCWLEIRLTLTMKKFLLIKTTYSAYLVFKLNEDSENLRKGTGRLKIFRDDKLESDKTCTVFLHRKEEEEEDQEEEVVQYYAEVRGGEEGIQGWMEMKLGEFETSSKDEGRSIELAFEDITPYWKYGLVVKGIEIRPSYAYAPTL